MENEQCRQIIKAFGLDPDAVEGGTISLEPTGLLLIAHFKTGTSTTQNLARELARFQLVPLEL